MVGGRGDGNNWMGYNDGVEKVGGLSLAWTLYKHF